MAELTFVRYQPGRSLIHRLDVRVKLIILILLSVSAARADLSDLALMGILIAAGFLSVRPLNFKFSLGIFWWLGFIGLVFAVRALTTAGTPIVTLGVFYITREGVYGGLQVAGRLLAIGLLGLLLVVSTRSIEIKAGIHWLLQPIPRLPAGRVATMLGLVLRFIPMIFEQARKTSAAIKARGIEQRRNPLYRIRYFALPLIRRLFEDTDNLILAMQARQYRDHRTDPSLSMQPIDWIFAVALALVSVWIWL
jgi:energy-coupling factor transporter transmembrane protein EcfT